jgi:hypothetical protein
MLSAGALRAAVGGFFSPAGMPRVAAVSKWAAAYASYAQSAVAGGTTLTGPLSPAAVETGDFFADLDSTLRAMWMSATWVGPGLTGTTASVPSLSAALRSNGSRLVRSSDPGLALQLTTDALHTYTLSIIVTVVSPAGSSPMPLT